MPEGFRCAAFVWHKALDSELCVEIPTLLLDAPTAEIHAPDFTKKSGTRPLDHAADALGFVCGYREPGPDCRVSGFIFAHTINFAIFPLTGFAILLLAFARRPAVQMTIAARSATGARQTLRPDTKNGGDHGHSRLSARATSCANRVVHA